jgi:phage-related baseplate assembly protein
MPKSDPFIGLPEIYFANVDVTALQTAVIDGFLSAWEADTGEKLLLLPSDRRYNFLSSATAWLLGAYAVLDASAKQNLIPYSQGGFLDNLAIFFNTTRLTASSAVATLEFTLSLASASAEVIPAGTQVASSSAAGVVFATDVDLTIPPTALNGFVSATCTTSGIAGNGLVDLNNLVNWTGNFVVSVTNSEPSVGGAPAESDSNLRLRLLDATDAYSPAGPKGRYKFYAESVSSAIGDVGVMGPEDGLPPGNVKVTVLLQDGTFPNSAFLDTVYDALDTENIRDMCAYLTVTQPTGVAYSVAVRYWADQEAINVPAIQTNVAANVQSWITGNKLALGGAIIPSSLSATVMAGGASHCIVDSPHTRIPLNLNQVGVLVDDVQVLYQGLEQDSQL